MNWLWRGSLNKGFDKFQATFEWLSKPTSLAHAQWLGRSQNYRQRASKYQAWNFLLSVNITNHDVIEKLLEVSLKNDRMCWTVDGFSVELTNLVLFQFKLLASKFELSPVVFLLFTQVLVVHFIKIHWILFIPLRLWFSFRYGLTSATLQKTFSKIWANTISSTITLIQKATANLQSFPFNPFNIKQNISESMIRYSKPVN